MNWKFHSIIFNAKRKTTVIKYRNQFNNNNAKSDVHNKSTRQQCHNLIAMYNESSHTNNNSLSYSKPIKILYRETL